MALMPDTKGKPMLNVPAILARIDHFETLASRAAYQAATAVSQSDAAEWNARADKYDIRAAEYRQALRKAA